MPLSAPGALTLSTIITLDSVSMTNNSAGNIGSRSLEPGTYLIWGVAHYLPGASTPVSYLEASLSLTTGVRDTTPGNWANIATPSQTPGSVRTSIIVPPRPVVMAATASVFLVGFNLFTPGTLVAGGAIYALRI